MAALQQREFGAHQYSVGISAGIMPRGKKLLLQNAVG